MDISNSDNKKATGDIPDELAMNYGEMNEAGKEKLLMETEQILQSDRKDGQLSEAIPD